MEGERQALVAELEAARSELTAARTARAALSARHYSAEETRLEEYSSEIRRLSHSNATLQAQCDMANAHLKALSAMARSTESQVRSRQGLLYGLLQQAEDIEASIQTPEQEDCEDPEERALKERLGGLSASCSKLSEACQEGPRPGESAEHSQQRVAMLTEEAQRLSREISEIDSASAALEEMCSDELKSQGTGFRSRIPGGSLASLEALVSQARHLNLVEEEMRKGSRENELKHLRKEVKERQGHFDRMTDDLQAQVAALQGEVQAGEHRGSSASNGELREMELLRQRKLLHLRDQEERLAEMERDGDLSQPPAPLVDPGVPDRLPPRSSFRRSNTAHRSPLRAQEPGWHQSGVKLVTETQRGLGKGVLPPGENFVAEPVSHHDTSRSVPPEVYRRHTDFQERMSELKAVIGSSLQSLAEEGWLSSDSGR